MDTCRQRQKNENLNDLYQYRVTLRCAMKLLQQSLSLFRYNFKFMKRGRPFFGGRSPKSLPRDWNATDSFTLSWAASEDAFGKAGIPQSTLNTNLCQWSFVLKALLWNLHVDSCWKAWKGFLGDGVLQDYHLSVCCVCLSCSARHSALQDSLIEPFFFRFLFFSSP